tara:strand:- start:3912 stop:4199 length:288 start_codon:yes stop_codon:yes gene_type:complete
MNIIDKKDGSGVAMCDPDQAEALLAEFELDRNDVEFILSQSEINREQEAFLQQTDWQVTRHRDQLESQEATSLTDAQYQQLLSKRQQARKMIRAG